MRIVARVSTAGESGFMSVPVLPHPAEYYQRDDGRLDEDALRRDIAINPCVMLNGDDNRAVLAFALEFMDRTRISLERMIATNKTVTESKDGDGKQTPAERRFDKGRFAFARVDIRHSSTGFRVTVSAQNPKEVVGHAEEFAKLYAQTFADNLIVISDAMIDMKDAPVTLIDGEGCDGVFAEARKRVDAQMLREKHWDCDRRRNGYCSPCKTDCPLYKDGRCEI